MTEGWVLFHYVQWAPKLNDLIKKKKKKKSQEQRGRRTSQWQRDRGGTSPEAYVESTTGCIAKGLAEVLQLSSKNLPSDGSGVHVALNLKVWSSRRSRTSGLWEELHCNQSCHY